MPPTSQFLSETAPKLHFLTYSSTLANRPSLIFLHGVTSHAHYWDNIAPEFSADYNVYALDWRGHGDSDYADSYDQIADYISDLQRLVAYLNPETFALVGHSLGGYVALVYATLGDSRLNKIVVCDVKMDMSESERQFMQKAAGKPQPRVASLEEIENRFASTLPDSSADRNLLNELARLGTRQNVEDGSYSFKYDRRVLNFPEPEPLKYATQVKQPVLVINGEKSQMVPGSEATRLAEALPNGRHEQISGAGHHVFLDKPVEFSQAVREFLKAA